MEDTLLQARFPMRHGWQAFMLFEFQFQNV
ncbi:hypothetical protein BLA18112_00105 [Burkholderia lata]|uniref:Uncharacterized protein n=1 Tax=Burkholderia lata (strain ATCC 17760 / DSM 23089 / LMG 22485 / NCIMB 9086 / R18194 / 383) TaxID=482957 RepID=A0A6P2NN70_BURL3|nr:hypothetical protein BLA6993_04603 [Burkholderia lata]VWC54702.1 hypothetical protein BLA18112_00105 [Burkholderia lata]